MLSKEVSTGMNSHQVDLLIIGAGASGANIAYEAIKRGLNVALLDAGDIGGGTSCRSTKLLHGGVRYLELAFKTFDLAQLQLVREALIERGHWLKQVPFLAHQIELALPTKNCFDTTYYRLGLGLYDILSGRKNIGNSRRISPEELSRALPFLSGISFGGIAYSDGQFDDARLNLLIALTAERAGAIVKTRCKVLKIKKNSEGKICGAISEDIQGHQESWETQAIVNATGNQADTLRMLADSNAKPRMLTSRGIHIVLEQDLCQKGIGLLIPETDDGRVLFILPFFGKTLVGTTDTPCKTEDATQPSDEEERYLVNNVRNWFPKIGEPVIKSKWAGGRPLLSPSKEKTNSSRVVREHEIEILPCGLISAMGGKWTTCRSIAMDTLKALEKVLNQKLPFPKDLPIIGTDENSILTKELLIKQRSHISELLPSSSVRKKQIKHLEKNYGLEALKIIKNSDVNQRKPLSDIIPLCEAEIQHFIKHEHAKTPTDLLARRCRLAMIDMNEAERLLPIVQEYLLQANLPPGELNLQK